MQKFEGMNEYYYSHLQNKHAELLEVQFAAFEATDSYFEKKGIIFYIQKYLNSEDVDFVVELTCKNTGCAQCDVLYSGKVKDVASPVCPECEEPVDSYKLVSTRPVLMALIQKYTAYEAELAPQEGNYESMLAQNTVYFLNTVKKFDTAITYVDKLALLNEAMPYYYSMNISSDEVMAAVAEYDALAAELAVVQKDSKAFIENVLMLPVALEEDGIDSYYTYLVAAAALIDKVDSSIKGIPEAIASFEAAVTEYEGTTGEINSELKESMSALGAFGANCGFTAVLSVILKQFISFS